MKKAVLLGMVGAKCFLAYSQTTPKLDSFKSFNTGQAFTCITVDSSHNVWAGTNKAGLFVLDQKASPTATSFNVASGASTIAAFSLQTLAADRLGNLWVGHNGAGSNTSAGGGVEQFNFNGKSLVKHYAPDRNAKGFSFLERDGLATLNAKSISVDINNTVWVAHRYHDLTVSPDYIVTPGAISYKVASATKFTTKGGYDTRGDYPEWPYPAYTYNPTPSQTPQSRVCYAISSDSNEVWVSVAAYTFDVSLPGFPIFGNLPARILRYDLNGTFKGVINFETIGIPAGGVFNSIYLSPKKDAWVSVTAGKGFAVRRNGNWTYLNATNLSCIIPAGTAINDNAIWGNKYGNVFIGTNKGLIVYNGRGPVTVSSSYTFYSSATNPDIKSDVIRGGFSENDSIQWIATDNGIMKAIIGRYPTADAAHTDYTSCKNQEMDEIEDLLNTPAIKRDRSYHIYKVETQICNIDSNKNCTAENIFKMMKEDMSLVAVTPYDFPLDGLTTDFLDALTLGDLAAVQANVNAWKLNPASTDPTSAEIKRIEDVLPREELKSTLDREDTWFQNIPYELGQIISLGYFGSLIPIKAVYDRQMQVNPKKLVSCTQRYLLYNSPNFIQSRFVFKSGNNFLWGAGRVGTGCYSGDLESASYDPIYTYANDREYTVTNYTSKGHMLYPGKITRQVIEECGKVKIVTIGEGVQFCGDNTAGRRNAYGNLVVGCILFKNVDFRVIKEFKKIK